MPQQFIRPQMQFNPGTQNAQPNISATQQVMQNQNPLVNNNPEPKKVKMPKWLFYLILIAFGALAVWLILR